MISDIAIEISGQAVPLPQDQSIDIEEKNPLFNDVEMFSLPVQLPFYKNRHILGNLDDVNSDMRATDIEGQTARIIIGGVPVRTTVLHVQDGETIKDSISVNFDSRRKTFKTMIENMKLRDITMDQSLIVGEKIGEIDFGFNFEVYYEIWFGGGGYGQFPQINTDPQYDRGSSVFTPPALGFSYPAKCSETPSVMPQTASTKDYDRGITVKVPTTIEKYTNVSKPYPEAAYCNMRVAYAHHDYDDEKGETSSNIVSADKATYVNEDYGPYWVLPADRPASGICFYVGYVLERLFKTLGVAYDMTALTDMEDFCRMAFVTTACRYTEEDAGYNSGLTSMQQINDWLESRGCGGQVAFETENVESKQSISEVTAKYNGVEYHFKVDEIPAEGFARVYKIYRQVKISSERASARINKMIATADNLPDSTVTEMIESLEAMFGVRFIYDPDINKVTVVMLRNVFRQTDDPIHFDGEITSIHKITEKISGVKMHYSAESDTDEQRLNVRNGVRDYDTDYDYIDYPPHRTLLKEYAEVVQKIDPTDMNVYVSPSTGNAIRIKVDKDANTIKDMKPVAFEVGGLHGVEVGDCSRDAEDDDRVQEISMAMQPIIVNDVNFRNGGTTNPDYQPLLVPYMDVDMEHEFVEAKIQSPFLIDGNEIYFTYVLKLMESYDPTSTDDGTSPLMEYDWGMTVGILRNGSGSEGIENYDPNYDGFGNWRWRNTSDNYCMSADTMDFTGRRLGNTSAANAISLKVRAYKPFRYRYVSGQLEISNNPNDWTDPSWLIPCADDERDAEGHITYRLRSRGLADTFMPEYFHWLLNRHKYKIKALMNIAALAAIPQNWDRRYEIDGLRGLIDKLRYSINEQKGIGEVEIDFYTI